MAFDIQVFNKQTHTVMTEEIAQDVNKFNGASNGTIILNTNSFGGDFDIQSSFKAISGLVRRRNAYGSGAIQSKKLEQMLGVAVKVAAGTPPLDWERQQYTWTQQNPELAAITIGKQLAKARIADQLNTGVAAGASAIGGQAAATHGDGTTDISFRLLNKGSAKFGDRSSAIRSWIMHSTSIHNLYDNALANTEQLFTYEGVNVVRDAFGRVFVVTDAPALVGAAGGEAIYNTLGLVEGAIEVADNGDFYQTITEKTGGENISHQYQAEWSYNVRLKGYSWDIANGGKSPNDAALATATNWDLIASDIKDTAGVLVKSK